LRSDYIIRHLRQPGDTHHYFPQKGMFRYVSSANYFGEFVEWVGFAIFTWSMSGVVFAIWTFANLAPRAHRLNKKYAEDFSEEYQQIKPKSIIPFIY
jgi:3-oxo-5-alpha-steroid 4-dehydrogenase 1